MKPSNNSNASRSPIARITLLARDACLYAPRASIPHLTRSPPHRCFRARHSRLPAIAGENQAERPFRTYPIGYFHIDIAEPRTGEAKVSQFVAIDRISKFVFAQFHGATNVHTAAAFLNGPCDSVSDPEYLARVHRVGAGSVEERFSLLW
jgi:hypothetical protein